LTPTTQTAKFQSVELPCVPPQDQSTQAGGSARNLAFNVSSDPAPSESLIAGFSSFGLAGLTAVDYLVDQMELVETGHVTAEGLPTITPFEEGVPHYPTRLFSREDLDVTVLVGELFVPAFAGEALSSAILEWTEREDVRDIAVLSGIPMVHSHEEHRTYYVATEDYKQRRLSETELPPMGRGFLDGAHAALVERGMRSSLGVGVYLTPVHQQAPDVEAAIRLVESVRDVYDLEVDSGPLRAFAEEIQQYYAGLAERMTAREEDLPEDRMYM
jgi:uncharacterized protein